MKVCFVHYKICWHLVVKVLVLVSLSIGIIIKVLLVLVSVSKKSKRYTALTTLENKNHLGEKVKNRTLQISEGAHFKAKFKYSYNLSYIFMDESLTT